MKIALSVLLSLTCAIALASCSGNSSPSPLAAEPSVTQGEVLQANTPAPSPQYSAAPRPTPLPSPAPSAANIPENAQEGDRMPSVTIQVGSKTFTAAMYGNASVRTIVQQMPFTLEMDDYASQEKVTGLTFPLPSASTEVPATINAGDIYLWSGNNLVLFYTTFSNSYSYVPVGYIEDVTGLKDALGDGSVVVAFRIGD